MGDSADEEFLHFSSSLIALEVLFAERLQIIRQYLQVLFRFENKNIVVFIFLQVVFQSLEAHV